MIAAVATCFFVIYLYKSLNAADAEPPESSSQSTADLAERLKALQLRLQTLSENSDRGRHS